MRRLKLLSCSAVILWTIAALTFAQDTGGDPGSGGLDPTLVPECAGCVWDNQLAREKTDYIQSCYEYQTGTPYMKYSGACSRFECANNKYAYRWEGWTALACQANNEVDDSAQCPNGSCKLVAGSFSMSVHPLTTLQASAFVQHVMSKHETK